jgi:hypothetical protein
MYTSDSLPVLLDFNVYQDDTMKRTIRLKDKATGQPVDLTNAAVKMQVRTPDLQTVVLTIETGNGITIVDSSIQIQKDVDIDAGEYVYDLQVVKDSVTTTYLKGGYFVTQNVTL